MPFDVQDFSGGSFETPVARRNRVLVAGWLFLMCGMILVMVALGGATRLTGSGLSIMEWAPFQGTLPPLSEAEWRRLYGLYRQIPQFHLLNSDIGLNGFKHIFWLEWVHRLWGRLMGVAFLVPLVALVWRGAIPRALVPRLAGLFVLGGLQGAVGWFMVASGFLPDSTAVSPYRLVIHLILALVLYAAILWTGLSVLRPVPRGDTPEPVRRLVQASVVLVGTTIVAGGFVAGLHAGLTYNSFPLMGGRLVPDSYAQLSPFLRNLTENVAAVQFDHRMLATATALTVIATVVFGLRRAQPGLLRMALATMAALVCIQYSLGVATLLWVVPVPLATAHQSVAVLLLTAALVSLHASRPVRVR